MDVPLDENLSFDHFTHWSVVALQDYCSKRGFPRTGSKAELAAMAYTAYRTKAPVQCSESEKVEQAKLAYQEKLTLPCGTLLPDPLTLKSGWEGEATGIKKWPSISHVDIIHYFTMKQGSAAKETLNKYKEGKAFSYFSSQYVKEVLYNRVTGTDACILKTCVTRSGSVGEEPHQTWVCTSLPSGDILRAYCTCTAGLHESCNHIAGLLFRVEAAVRSGLNAPSCTSLPSSWLVPAAKTVVLLGEVHTFDFIQPSATQTKSRLLVSKEKRLFQPHNDETSSIERRDKLMASLSKIKPQCAASLMWLAERAETEVQDKNSNVLPACPVAMYLEDYIVGKTLQFQGSIEQKVDHIMHNMPLITETEVRLVSSLTVLQSEDERWKRARIGRIPSSKFGRVDSRVRTLLDSTSNRNKDVVALLCELMNYKPPNPNIPSLRYGRENEIPARTSYVKYQIEKGHVNVNIDLVGLNISTEDVYLAASPDLLVRCDCCSEGLAEIKCPFTMADTSSIISFPLTFMDYTDGHMTLKKSHSYYAQIQGQLAVTKRVWCDLVIYCAADIFVERIFFDEDYWLKLKSNLSYFYNTYMLHEIITHEHRPTEEVEKVKSMYKRSTYLQRKKDAEQSLRAEADQAIQIIACNVTISK